VNAPRIARLFLDRLFGFRLGHPHPTCGAPEMATPHTPSPLAKIPILASASLIIAE
jgi:hypothetical protein